MGGDDSFGFGNWSTGVRRVMDDDVRFPFFLMHSSSRSLVIT